MVKPVSHITEESFLDTFSRTLDSCNYVVMLQVCSFNLAPGHTLQIDDLSAIPDDMENIYGIRQVKGTLKEVPFCQAQTEINYYISHVSEGVFPEKSQDLNLVHKRTAEFWSLFAQKFELPPMKTYCYEPNPRTRFTMGFMWNIVYLFIHDDQGILIAMGATD